MCPLVPWSPFFPPAAPCRPLITKQHRLGIHHLRHHPDDDGDEHMRTIIIRTISPPQACAFDYIPALSLQSSSSSSLFLMVIVIIIVMYNHHHYHDHRHLSVPHPPLLLITNPHWLGIHQHKLLLHQAEPQKCSILLKVKMPPPCPHAKILFRD